MTSGLLVVGGLVALIVGAEVLVRAGSGLASWLGIRPMMFVTHSRISRVEGGLFVATYVGYLSWLLLTRT
jgi:Ca2+/Na+ antiporter